MTRAAGCIWGAFAAMALGCGPAPVVSAQVLLVVETDAPLPALGLGPDGLSLFDRLRVEVFLGDSSVPCTGCAREFVLEASRPSELSLGLVVGDAPAVAKVQIFALRNLDRDGRPDEGSALTAWVRLPKPASGEVRRAYVALRVADLAHPRGARHAPIETTAGPVTPPLGRWPDARRLPCTIPVTPDEVCVPGGVVWMGDAARTPGSAGGLAPRLVALSPFVLDRHEVTVAEMRRSGLALTDQDIEGEDPVVSPENGCTYSPDPSPFDGYPVTCITWGAARRYCRETGKTLPSEAQFEYAQGALRGWRYPWGDEDPTCGALAFGRGPNGPCGGTGVPSPVGSSRLDRLSIPGSPTVDDLAGNVSEWAREPWHTADDVCNAQGFFRDPVCPLATSAEHAKRGGDFVRNAFATRSYVRIVGAAISSRVGFRCARDGTVP